MAGIERMRRAATLVAGLVILASCASQQSGQAIGPDFRTITEAEVDSAHAVTAYELIYKLRPQFLQGRGKLSLDPRVPTATPRVYVDEQYYGEISSLRAILADVIGSVHFYTGSDAQYKFGHDNAAGVIAIITKR